LKRSLITAAAFYLIYDRQRRVERRQKLWKLRTEAELRHWLLTTDTELNDAADGYHDWADRLMKEIKRAFEAGAS